MSVVKQEDYPLVFPGVFTETQINIDQIKLDKTNFFLQFKQYEQLSCYCEEKIQEIIQKNSNNVSITKSQFNQLKPMLTAIQTQNSIMPAQIQLFQDNFNPLLLMSSISKNYRRIYVVKRISELTTLAKQFDELYLNCNSLMDAFKLIQIYNIINEKSKENFWLNIHIIVDVKQSIRTKIETIPGIIKQIIYKKKIQNLTLDEILILFIIAPSNKKSIIIGPLLENSKARFDDIMFFESKLNQLKSIINTSLIDQYINDFNLIKDRCLSSNINQIQDIAQNFIKNCETNCQFENYIQFLTHFVNYLPSKFNRLPERYQNIINRHILNLRTKLLNQFRLRIRSKDIKQLVSPPQTCFNFFFCDFPTFSKLLSNAPYFTDTLVYDDCLLEDCTEDFTILYKENFFTFCKNKSSLFPNIVDKLQNLIDVVEESCVPDFPQYAFSIFETSLKYIQEIFTLRYSNGPEKKRDPKIILRVGKRRDSNEFFDSSFEPLDLIAKIRPMIKVFRNSNTNSFYKLDPTTSKFFLENADVLLHK